jgi:CheY-like chemotaxis protein
MTMPDENNNKRILIVDDCKEVIDALSLMLSKYATVETASNGNEALVKML